MSMETSEGAPQEVRLHGQPCPCSIWNLPGPAILNLLLLRKGSHQVPAVLPSFPVPRPPGWTFPRLLLCGLSQTQLANTFYPGLEGILLTILHSQKEGQRARKTCSLVYWASRRRLSESEPQLSSLQSLSLLCSILATVPGV